MTIQAHLYIIRPTLVPTLCVGMVWVFLLIKYKLMPKYKIVFDERFEIYNQVNNLIKRVVLTVRLKAINKATTTKVEIAEPRPQTYEMTFINGDRVENKIYYASQINDLRDLFVSKLQKVVDQRDPEKTSVKLNSNNRYFKSALVTCPHCGTAVQRYYGFRRGLETKCRRCRRVFTSA